MDSQSQDRELRERHRRLRRAVRTALREADPIGLLALGAPTDEYELEVGTIVPRLAAARSEDDVRQIVAEEISRWCGADAANQSAERCDLAAGAIWTHIKVRGASGPPMR